MLVLVFQAVDPALGKVDKDSLSQQTLMEIFISTIENKEIICGTAEESREISEWRGVRMDETGQISSVTWLVPGTGLKGSLELQWLPSTVKMFTVQRNVLVGTVDLICLSVLLREMYLSDNRFSGSVDLTHLPDGMISLALRDNRFSGSVDLTCLPDGLQKLYLYGNGFSGLTDFSKLPASLTTLNVSTTQLSGDLKVPKNILSVGNFHVHGSNVKIHFV